MHGYHNPNIGLTTTPDYQRWLDDQGTYPDANFEPTITPDDCCAACSDPLPQGWERDLCRRCQAEVDERDAAIREDQWHNRRKGEAS